MYDRSLNGFTSVPTRSITVRMQSQSRFRLRLAPKTFNNPEYASIALVDDEEENTKPDHSTDCLNISQFGPVPKVQVVEDPTAERCITCGRHPGVVSAPGADRFDLGVKHALNRMYKLLRKSTGCTQEEAKAIVLKLRADDVELP